MLDTKNPSIRGVLKELKPSLITEGIKHTYLEAALEAALGAALIVS